MGLMANDARLGAHSFVALGWLAHGDWGWGWGRDEKIGRRGVLGYGRL